MYRPTGYPLALCVVHQDNNQPEFIAVPVSFQHTPEGKRKSVSKVNILELIDTFGHKQTNKFLRTFADSWLTKEGSIFFRELKKTNDRTND